MTLSPGSEQVPVIDLGDGLAPSDPAEGRIAARLGQAARGIGFFYLAGHGIPPALVEGAFAASRRFFALPEAQKAMLSITRRRDNRGYVGLGVERLDPAAGPDLKEAFNIGASDRPDGDRPDGDWPDGDWPDGDWPDLPGFRPAVLAYRDAMAALSLRVHRLFARDLGLPPDFFDACFARPMATLRLLHYPPRRPGPAAPGAGAHTDYGCITLLAQDEAGGLEVRRRDGRWIAAPPIPGALVCNIGDCLMRWSNDIYVSNPHRVASPAGRERYSIAYFSDPDPATLVSCLPGCVSADNPARYPPITAGDYLAQRLDATYAFRSAGPAAAEESRA